MRLAMEKLERGVLTQVNSERKSRHIPSLAWDNKLHKIAKKHSQEMARQGKLFHSSVNECYAENCWGGGPGSLHHNALRDIVKSWMRSSKHKTWLFCPHLKHIGVGIATSGKGVYASWTFWRGETRSGDWWY